MEASKRQTKARGIIEDVFRRADKNDDGSLSLEEFQTFFSDGMLTSKQLEELFREIDTHKTNNLDTSELCEYFAKYWGPFKEIFATLDDLGTSITQAVHSTAQKYSEQTPMEQFATRFLLKETLNHMSHLQIPLDSAVEKLEEDKPMESMSAESLTKNTAVVKPRWQQKVQRSRSTDQYDGGRSSLGGEVGRLAELINKLENKVQFNPVEEEEVAPGSNSTVTVVSRDMTTSEELVKDFLQSVKLYTEGIYSQEGILHILVRSYSGTYHYSIFEVWEDNESLQRHYSSKASKMFRRACIDQLVSPEDCKTISLPASWWPEQSEEKGQLV